MRYMRMNPNQGKWLRNVLTVFHKDQCTTYRQESDLSPISGVANLSSTGIDYKIFC